MLSCRWQLLAFGRRMQFSKSVCIFIYMLLQLHFVRVRCVRQLFRFAAGGSFSFLLQVATFLLCCRRQLFSCAAGGSFSLVLQEAAFLSCCRRQLFRFFLQEAAFLLCCRRQLSLSRCRKQLFFPFGAVGCCNVSCSFLCAVCVTGLAPCGVFSFCHARCCDVRSSQLKLN